MATRAEVDAAIPNAAAIDKAELRAILKDGITDDYASTASAGTVDLGAVASRNVLVTGTTTITAFGTAPAGTWRRLRFSGALVLTHNATSLIIPGAANITTVAGDRAEVVSLGSGNWIVVSYVGATLTQMQAVLGSTSVGRAVFAAADAAAARNAISAPATPIGSSGVGQWVKVQSSLGGAFATPSGGSWAWIAQSINNSTGLQSDFNAGVNSGGSNVVGASAGIYHTGMCWRIS